MELALSEEQVRVYLAEGRTILAVGATGSGKTHATVLAFVDFALSHPPALHLITGRSTSQLDIEVRPHIERRLSQLGCRPEWNGVARRLRAAGHVFAFYGYTDTRSEERFRGLTARTALVEEATLCSEEFVGWLQTRLRMSGARMWMTANPEGPTHWLKQRIDAGLLDSVHTLLMRDNPALDAETRADLERQFVPGSVQYRRAILGEWAAATGLIFPSVPTSEAPGGTVTTTAVGIDFGMTSPTAVVRIVARTRPASYWASHAWTIASSRDGVSVHPSEQARRIVEWHQTAPWEVAYVDPSAKPLTAELRRIAPFAVQDAAPDVALGIASLARNFARETLTIAPGARPLLEELAGYVWDTKRPDEPLKANDHCVDALRYGFFALDRRPVFGVL